MRKVSLRLLPFLFFLYIFNFLDRTNVALAALQMNRDLRFSSSAFGLGAGIFFVGYALFEVPSNLILVRVGARRWIARIMISWGIIASAMMFVRTPIHFYALRLLLGIAEAGFFPGIVYYLTQWFPATGRARAASRFMIAIPLSGVVGGVFGGFLLGLDGRLGLAGWQWLFLLEGLPSVVLGVVVLWSDCRHRDCFDAWNARDWGQLRSKEGAMLSLCSERSIDRDRVHGRGAPASANSADCFSRSGAGGSERNASAVLVPPVDALERKCSRRGNRAHQRSGKHRRFRRSVRDRIRQGQDRRNDWLIPGARGSWRTPGGAVCALEKANSLCAAGSRVSQLILTPICFVSSGATEYLPDWFEPASRSELCARLAHRERCSKRPRAHPAKHCRVV